MNELERAVRDAAEYLMDLADILDSWAEHSLKGGWSTHQVSANEEWANNCRRKAGKLRSALSTRSLTDERTERE